MQSLTTTSRQGNTHWLVQPELKELLIDSEGFRFAEWEQAGRLDTVKNGPHRTVYRLTLDAGCYYLKHYRVGDIKAVLQNIVRPSRAMREWTAAQRIAALGISTIETVGIGRTIRYGLPFDSFLACKSIDNTESLDVFVLRRLKQFSASRRLVIRRKLAQAMGSLVATLHRGGVVHRDLHAENILVRLEADDRIRLSLIDLHAVSFVGKMTQRKIERNLAMLNPALVYEMTRIDRLRFFRTYWREMIADTTTPTRSPKHVDTLERKSVSNRIAAFCIHDLARMDRKRDKKWAHGNRRLIVADTNGIRCRGLAGLGREQLLALRDNIESLVESTTAKPGDGDLRMSADRMTTLIDHQERQCRVQYQQLPARHGWQRLRGVQSEVRRAWEFGHACLRRNIPIARPIAFVERESEGKSQQYLLIEQMPSAVSLSDLMKQQPFRTDAADRLAQITINVAQMLQRLHAANLDYKSLSAEAILVDAADPNLPTSFASPAHICRRVPAPVDTLAELYSSVAQHHGLRLTMPLRFLRHYLAERFDREWKTIWRAVRQLVTISPSNRLTDTRLRQSA